jgi:hypothetical protein
MKAKQSAGQDAHDGMGLQKREQLLEEDEGPRVKISISVPPEVLERIDAYRRRRGGLNRSALFALAADWFMDEHPLKKD